MTKQEERELAARLVKEIGRMAEQADHTLRFMEVCGTHTVAIFRAGLRQCCLPRWNSCRARAVRSA